MDRSTHKVDIVYNTDRVNKQIGLDKEHFIYDKVDLFVDRMNKDKGWVLLTYKEYKNKKEIVKQEIITFNNRDDRKKFLFNCQAKEIHVHDIDYATVCIYLYDKRTEKNYMEINYLEYINGKPVRKTMRVPKEYMEMMIQTIKEYRKNDPRTSLSFDGYYREIRVDEKKEKDDKEEKELPKRIPRSQRRREKEAKELPMSEDREDRKRKIRIMAFATATVMGIIAAGYVIIKDAFKDKPIVFEQKKESIFNQVDRFIIKNKDKASLIIDKLMDHRYSELSRSDIELLFQFIDKVGISNFDKNPSSTKVLYDDYFSDKYLSKDDGTKATLRYLDVDELLEEIENKYSSCFAYDNDGFLALREHNVKRYLDFVGSLSVLKNKYPGAWNMSIPKEDDSEKNYASTKEVSVFENLDPVVRIMILSQYEKVLANYNYTPEKTPYYFQSTIDKETLQRRVREEIESLKTVIMSNYNASELQGRKM